MSGATPFDKLFVEWSPLPQESVDRPEGTIDRGGQYLPGTSAIKGAGRCPDWKCTRRFFADGIKPPTLYAEYRTSIMSCLLHNTFCATEVRPGAYDLVISHTEHTVDADDNHHLLYIVSSPAGKQS